MLDVVAYPGCVLKKVMDHDSAAWDKLTAHADALFKTQRDAQLISLKPQDAAVPNPFILIRNAFARAHNAALGALEHDPYFFSPATLQDDFTVHRYTSVLPATSMTGNLAAALLFYIERDPCVAPAAGITPAELRGRRRYVGMEKQNAPRTPRHA